MSKYHDILGVAKDASKDDVKKAYRTLASKHHPDKGGDEEKFKEIQEAYDRVSHPEKYINEGFRQQPRQNTPGSFWQNINVQVNRDGFHQAFEDHFRRQQQQLRMQFELDLESTLHEQTRTIHIPEYNIPPTEIVIPAGIRHGDTINYANVIQDTSGQYQNSIMIQFVIRRHPNFEVVNHVHLVQYKTVDALDAMVGTTLNITTIDGGELKVKLPAGSENGTKLKIPAKGLKYKDRPNIRGDMYIEIGISMPTLTAAEKEIITKLRDKRKK